MMLIDARSGLNDAWILWTLEQANRLPVEHSPAALGTTFKHIARGVSPGPQDAL